MLSSSGLKWFALVVVVCFTTQCVNSEGCPVVASKDGKLRGMYVSNGKVSAFLGIPYSKPITKENRFKKPEPVKSWEGTYDATTKAPICMQMSRESIPWVPKGNRSEDCLFLNIWTPARCGGLLKGKSCKLPVMVWIHGGGYYSGWSGEDFYDGEVISAVGDVVVVTLNYRVGSFGFFASGTEDAPGNIGMHDQVLALKWIKNNIDSFGGDPNSITIFGESAGAISVGLHVLSPLSKDLFHRAILQSGGPYHPQLASPLAVGKLKSNMLASSVGCSDDQTNLDTNPEKVIQCMREIDAEELAKAEDTLMGGLPLFFIPTHGDDFMPLSPTAAADSGNFNRVPTLMGNNKDEGAIFMYILLPQFFNATHAPTLNSVQAKMLIAGLFQNNVNPTPDVIADFYVKDVDDENPEAIVQKVYNSFGDNIFTCPSMFFAERLSDVYSYFFTHRPSNSRWGEWTGVTHFEEVPFVFGLPLKYPQLYTSEEVAFSREIINIWTTFARNGVPCEGSNSSEWPKYSPSTHLYKELNPTSSKIGEGPRLKACDFWREYFVSKR